MPRRNKVEIFIDMLRSLSVNGPLPPTRILYCANVPAKEGFSMISDLLKNNYIEIANPTEYYIRFNNDPNLKKRRVVYKITEKGEKSITNFVTLAKEFQF